MKFKGFRSLICFVESFAFSVHFPQIKKGCYDFLSIASPRCFVYLAHHLMLHILLIATTLGYSSFSWCPLRSSAIYYLNFSFVKKHFSVLNSYCDFVIVLGSSCLKGPQVVVNFTVSSFEFVDWLDYWCAFLCLWVYSFICN